jgi:hypothetical protein
MKQAINQWSLGKMKLMLWLHGITVDRTRYSVT